MLSLSDAVVNKLKCHGCVAHASVAPLFALFSSLGTLPSDEWQEETTGITNAIMLFWLSQFDAEPCKTTRYERDMYVDTTIPHVFPRLICYSLGLV